MLIYIYVSALAALEPGEVVALTVVMVALAVAFLAHEWRAQFRAERLRH